MCVCVCVCVCVLEVCVIFDQIAEICFLEEQIHILSSCSHSEGAPSAPGGASVGTENDNNNNNKRNSEEISKSFTNTSNLIYILL